MTSRITQKVLLGLYECLLRAVHTGVLTEALLHVVTSAVSSVSVTGVELSVDDEMNVLGVVLDRSLTFEKHVMMVIRSGTSHSTTYDTSCQQNWYRHYADTTARAVWNSLPSLVIAATF